ncbi:uncharacterized protein LOC135370615 [Ornithodoros turicata]|uniref:uncharacterized protein LOC135370615 n=1 Tax=Ornithodoros turicata TaxID=34597 RepID=UPI003139273A
MERNTVAGIASGTACLDLLGIFCIAKRGFRLQPGSTNYLFDLLHLIINLVNVFLAINAGDALYCTKDNPTIGPKGTTEDIRFALRNLKVYIVGMTLTTVFQAATTYVYVPYYSEEPGVRNFHFNFFFLRFKSSSKHVSPWIRRFCNLY